MDEEQDWQCRICSGPVIPMGVLGNRLHGKCRNCGMCWSVLVEEQEVEDGDDD